jgi:hypothetical protein
MNFLWYLARRQFLTLSPISRRHDAHRTVECDAESVTGALPHVAVTLPAHYSDEHGVRHLSNYDMYHQPAFIV